MHSVRYQSPILALLLVTVAQTATTAAEFLRFGSRPGYHSSYAREVSDDGNVVVGTTFADDHFEAVRWTESDGMVGLGFLPGDGWSAAGGDLGGISGDGSTIVGQSGGGHEGWDSFIYTDAGGMQGLGYRKSEPADLSFDGSVVVGSIQVGDSDPDRAFRWTREEGIVDLGRAPGAVRSHATVVSADGSVIWGNNVYAQTNKPFRWTESTGMVEIETTRSTRSAWVRRGSRNGEVVAGTRRSTSGEREAFRWTEETGDQGLGWLPGTNGSIATGISGDGNTIIGNCVLESEYRGFIWTEQFGMEDLQQVLIDRYDLGATLAGWKQMNPQDISANGQFIVGIGLNPEGSNEGWLVRLDRPFLSPSGDLNADGQVDVQDVDALSAALLANSGSDQFDLNLSGNVDAEDLTEMIQLVLGTWFGDANLDGQFNSNDFVQVFLAGQYEDTIADNSTWSTGDWNADGEFSSSDFVLAFQDGGYEQGPRAAIAAVPEPSSAVVLLSITVVLLRWRRFCVRALGGSLPR